MAAGSSDSLSRANQALGALIINKVVFIITNPL